MNTARKLKRCTRFVFDYRCKWGDGSGFCRKYLRRTFRHTLLNFGSVVEQLMSRTKVHGGDNTATFRRQWDFVQDFNRRSYVKIRSNCRWGRRSETSLHGIRHVDSLLPCRYNRNFNTWSQHSDISVLVSHGQKAETSLRFNHGERSGDRQDSYLISHKQRYMSRVKTRMPYQCERKMGNAREREGLEYPTKAWKKTRARAWLMIYVTGTSLLF